MRGQEAPTANHSCRTVLAVVSTMLLASCSATSDPIQRLGLNPQSPEVMAAPQAVPADVPAGQQNYYIIAEDDPVLPDMVSQVPQLQSGAAPVVMAALEQPAVAPAQAPAATAATETQPAAPEPAKSAAAQIATAESAPQQPTASAPVQQASPEQPQPASAFAAPAPQQQKRGLFASLFSRQTSPTPQRAVAAPGATQAIAAQETVQAGSEAARRPNTFIENRPSQPLTTAQRNEGAGLYADASGRGDKPQPVLQFASIASAASQPGRAMYNSDALPGVRKGALFEINRRDSMDNDADIDLYEDGDSNVQLASAAGLARLAPNGLLKQTDNVDVACLKPSLVRMLKTIESRYGKKMVVTSGYRSPPRNRAARGAKNSLHMYCAAADVQVPGVDKWELAQFIRAMPGRGGVGTYCHTNSVHVDVGPERDWNWRCRRGRR